MRYTKTIAALAATGAIGLAAAPVLAQDDGATETDDATQDAATDQDSATPDDATDRDAEREARRAQEVDEIAAALADELGIDEDEVSAALTTVMDERRTAREAERAAARQERLDAAVEDGSLTQEQADALAELGEAGVFRGRGGPFGGGERGHGGPMGDAGPHGSAPSDEVTPDA